jgi:hypothetical protein
MLRLPLLEHFDEETADLRLTPTQMLALAQDLSGVQLMNDEELRAREDKLRRETAFIID